MIRVKVLFNSLNQGRLPMSDRYHLAQINIATLRAPLHDPSMTDFVAQIRDINAVADADPGFVWRLRSEGADDATNIRAFENENTLLTLTMWKSVEALSDYVYRSAHGAVMRDRRRWFVKTEGAILALWWVPVGHRPTVAEGKTRLEHLQKHGSSQYAFSFGKPHAAPDALMVSPNEVEFNPIAYALVE
jgi:hypothetical protein